jgi:hypothetical protein
VKRQPKISWNTVEVIVEKSKLILITLLVGLITIWSSGKSNASTVTWTLEGVTPFSSGQTASGFFSIDQQLGTVIDWNLAISGGSNPDLTNLSFRTNDTGCLVFCASPIVDSPSFGTSIEFRTPLASDNTLEEFNILIVNPPTEVIHPSSRELVLGSLDMPADTSVDKVMLIPNGNLSELEMDPLLTSATARIVAVPEPSTWAMMLVGFAGLGYAGYRRARVRQATLAA